MNTKRFLLFVVVFASLAVGWKMPTAQQSARVDFGKIYLTNTHLFVGEMYSGIRIYDISSMTSARSVGFIPLDGNEDVAVNGTIMYADNWTDLLIFDLSDPAHPVLIDSVPNVFAGRTRPAPMYTYPGEDTYGGAQGCSLSNGCGTGSSTSPMYNRDGSLSSGSKGGSGGGSGQAGSMARFAIVDSWLYCIDQSNLIVFDIREAARPKLVGNTAVGFGIETLFPYKYYLFIGSQTGMFIYDARDIKVPVKVSEFRHARACDPVVVEGNRAYVTLHNGTRCGDSENELHVVDITDLANPALLISRKMDNPMGLAVVDGIAYVCDGANVRILDVRDEKNIKELSVIAIGSSYDVIYSDGLLVVTAPNGIYIFNVTNPSDPVKISEILNIS